MYKLILVLVLFSNIVQAVENTKQPQNQSAQFISFWKSHVVTAEQDKRIVLVERVYERLLRAWDSTRLEPGLFVVDSDTGPWAASLVDGNILLSLKALQAISSFGEARAEHLLAFVLAHELAHQRSDDLWQHRFFRLNQPAGTSDSLSQQQNLIAEFQIDERGLADMQLKEAQADHDGLILMSSVGFNPYQVIGKKDFFTQWVENIWLQPCDNQQNSALRDACMLAKKRALRAHSQLDLVASQSSLYELGVQALVANNTVKARYYFTQYGRDFPNRAVMSALGLSYLTEAIQLKGKLIQQGLITSPEFFYPLILDATAGINVVPQSGLKRAAVGKFLQQQQVKINNLVEQSIAYFEKAIRLQPDYKNSYHSLASAYLLSENSFMVRGVLQGKYIPKFGQDAVSAMLLAMTLSVEGQPQQAIVSLKKITESPGFDDSKLPKSTMQHDLVKYSVIYNLSTLLKMTKQADESDELWQTFTKSAQASGNANLFRLGLAQLQQDKTDRLTRSVLKQSPTINGLRLGNKKTRDDSGHSINELWIEGEQFHVYNYNNGAQFITGADGRIISARQQAGSASLEKLLKSGDDASRPIKTLGLPDRRINLLAGEYLAYDQYGLALHVDDNKIQGWFLY